MSKHTDALQQQALADLRQAQEAYKTARHNLHLAQQACAMAKRSCERAELRARNLMALVKEARDIARQEVAQGESERGGRREQQR